MKGRQPVEFNLTRNLFGTHSTVSEVTVMGRHLCHVLEDVVREEVGVPVSEWKVKGETAIPAGRYEIVIDMSTRFGKLMPHLLNVPGFDGIRIHPGNTDHDTEGCLLPGTEIGPDGSVLHSRDAYEHWYDVLAAALHSGDRCFITVQ